MPPRTILYTGKGGVGKTSVAAATGRACAAAGLRTLVLSTDPAHSLGDCLHAAVGREPTPAGERLWAQQVDAQAELERNWSAVRRRLGELLAGRGVDRIRAEQLIVPPGLDELFSLLALKRHYDEAAFDAVIVDCAPTGETLRLLSFPDVARWWLEKLPLARALLGMAGEDVVAQVQRLVRNLVAMNEILRDGEHVSLRLVMTPERMVIDEARRTFTYLNLYGYVTDAVVVNRVFPDDVGDYFRTWRDRQRAHVQAVRDGFAPVPVLCAPFFAHEVVGPQALDELAAALFAGGVDAAARLHASVSQELVVEPHAATLRLDLPFATKSEIELKKIGLELVVRADGCKRTLLLPPALDDYRPTGASFTDGVLQVSFAATVPTPE
jgi:arsenite-transporting ATPase